jgi:hypothetical protein
MEKEALVLILDANDDSQAQSMDGAFTPQDSAASAPTRATVERVTKDLPSIRQCETSNRRKIRIRTLMRMTVEK